MMKSFEQRKDEILSRSKARIAKRRRIYRLTGAAACFVCVALVAAIRPWPEKDNMSANSAAYTDTSGIANEICEAAGQESIPAEEKPELYRYEFTAKEAGTVDLRITNIDTETDTLTMALSNYSGQKITYSPWFDIEQQTEEGWASCAESDLSWDCVLYILEPGDTVTETYWMGNFDLSEPGTYRLVKDCNLYIEENSEPHYVMTEFTVEEEAP